MPLSSDPNEFAPVYLLVDEDKPLESRPTFHARFLTVSEMRKVARLIDEAYQTKDDTIEHLKLDEAMAIQYCGWKNLTDRDGKPAEYRVVEGRLQCDGILGPFDKWELARAAVPATQETLLEKKRSRLLSRSGAASSAKSVTTSAAATNPTPPTNPTASTFPA